MKNIFLVTVGIGISLTFGFAAGKEAVTPKETACMASFNGQFTKQTIEKYTKDGWTVKMMAPQGNGNESCLIIIFEK